MAKCRHSQFRYSGGAASRAARAPPMLFNCRAAGGRRHVRSVALPASRSAARSAFCRASFASAARRWKWTATMPELRVPAMSRTAMTASAVARLLLWRAQRNTRSGSQGRRAWIG